MTTSNDERIPNGKALSNGHPATGLDVIIIGAGFAGLRMLYDLKKRGFSAKVFEAGSNVGGTWYWNKYPGARTDTESWIYIFSFLEEIGLDWSWKERYPTQPEVEEYLNRVTDHLDLRQHIQFNTRISSAIRDETSNQWTATTSEGAEYSSTYLVSAIGALSTPLKPDFPGLDSFQGEWYQTALWPDRKVDFVGKRVAVIGTGATGVQVIPIVAHSAKSVTVFQRTPNFVLPSRNHPLSNDQMSEIKRNYDKHRQRARGQTFGMDFIDVTRKMSDMKSDVDIEQVFDRGWEQGGFRYIFTTFADIVTSSKCNEAACEYIRKKIRAIVQNEETAELLCPYHPLLSKRPPLGHHYYETFNRDNVSLVDVRNNSIKAVTPTGLRTANAEYDFDIIIFAMGFDAITGPLALIDIRNGDNELLAEKLQKKMATGYGLTVPGFPNLFLIGGPHCPFANLPVVTDNAADWIGNTMEHMRAKALSRIDTTVELGDSWRTLILEAFQATILSQGAKDTRSWYVGANVDGKTVEPLSYFGGVGPYFERIRKVREDGYPGFVLS